MRPHRFIALLLAALATLGASPANSQQSSEEQMANDLIHSDLPLFGDGVRNKWPQSFHDKETFGCATPVPFGDWVLREQNAAGREHTE